MPGPSTQNSKKHSSGAANAVFARGFRTPENFTQIMFSITDRTKYPSCSRSSQPPAALAILFVLTSLRLSSFVVFDLNDFEILR